jgi:hypothetical protein
MHAAVHASGRVVGSAACPEGKVERDIVKKETTIDGHGRKADEEK